MPFKTDALCHFVTVAHVDSCDTTKRVKLEHETLSGLFTTVGGNGDPGALTHGPVYFHDILVLGAKSRAVPASTRQVLFPLLLLLLPENTNLWSSRHLLINPHWPLWQWFAGFPQEPEGRHRCAASGVSLSIWKSNRLLMQVWASGGLASSRIYLCKQDCCWLHQTQTRLVDNKTGPLPFLASGVQNHGRCTLLSQIWKLLPEQGNSKGRSVQESKWPPATRLCPVVWLGSLGHPCPGPERSLEVWFEAQIFISQVW